MGLSMQKFLNTITHFSKSSAINRTSIGLGAGVTRFYAPSATGISDTTETTAGVRQPTPENIIVRAVVVRIEPGNNTRADATTIRIRDDAADVGDIMTIGAGLDGNFIFTLATPPIIAQNSLWNISVTTGAGAGIFQHDSITVVYDRVLN